MQVLLGYSEEVRRAALLCEGCGHEFDSLLIQVVSRNLFNVVVGLRSLLTCWVSAKAHPSSYRPPTYLGLYTLSAS